MNDGYFGEDVGKFIIKKRLNFLRIRNVLDKSCTENQDMNFLYSILYFIEKYTVKGCWGE